MQRLAQLTASGATPLDASRGRSESFEDALGVAGFLNKVRDILFHVVKAEDPEVAKSEASVLNDLLDSQEREFLTAQEIQALKSLCSQVINDLLPKRYVAIEKRARAE